MLTSYGQKKYKLNYLDKCATFRSNPRYMVIQKTSKYEPIKSFYLFKQQKNIKLVIILIVKMHSEKAIVY